MTINIHLYQPDSIAQSTTCLLDHQEQARANTFAFDKDKALYIAAHTFLRQTLSQYAPLSSEQWKFQQNTYGKPSIANIGYERLHFSLSYTQGFVACAISEETTVGFDVEKVTSLPDLDTLCHYALSTKEAKDVLGITDLEQRKQRFFTYWTLKEAYIKARGMGLSLPLQQFTLEQNKHLNWQLQSDETSPLMQHEMWRFEHKEINHYHLSLCVPKSDHTICWLS